MTPGYLWCCQLFCVKFPWGNFLREDRCLPTFLTGFSNSARERNWICRRHVRRARAMDGPSQLKQVGGAVVWAACLCGRTILRQARGEVHQRPDPPAAHGTARAGGKRVTDSLPER